MFRLRIKGFCPLLRGLQTPHHLVQRIVQVISIQRRADTTAQQTPLLLLERDRKHITAVSERKVVVADFFDEVKKVQCRHMSSVCIKNSSNQIFNDK